MSTVIPVPAGAIAGVVALIVAAELGAPELASAALAFVVALIVLFGWSMSDRLPNGGGPM